MQGQGLGGDLLVDALRRVQFLADEIGIRAVEVDAIDDAARRFYERNGFVPLLDNPRHLFLPVRVIRALKLSPPPE
jgi:GNAT superfamily N-acetyltransferase